MKISLIRGEKISRVCTNRKQKRKIWNKDVGSDMKDEKIVYYAA